MEIQSSISLYFIENVHMYIHIVHEYIFTFKNIEGLRVSIPVYSEIVCIIVYKKWTKFLAPLKYHQKLNVNFPCKCSLTAQNVFTCSAWRHVLVLYTVAIVKIFFYCWLWATIGRCYTTLSRFFCVHVQCSLSFSILKFAHHDVSTCYTCSFLSICASKGKVWKSITCNLSVKK